jgi:ABC-type cobalt transport system substrate-binding protein
MKKLVVIVGVLVVIIVLVTYTAMKNKNTKGSDDKGGSTTAETLEVQNKGPFAHYWTFIHFTKGFEVEVLLNGQTLFASGGRGDLAFTTNKAQDMLKDGENTLSFKVLSVVDGPKQYNPPSIGIYIKGTDKDGDYKFDGQSPDLTKITSYELADEKIKVGTYDYSFEIKK